MSLVLEVRPWEHVSDPSAARGSQIKGPEPVKSPFFMTYLGFLFCFFDTFPLEIPKEKPFQPPTLYLVGGGPFQVPWNSS